MKKLLKALLVLAVVAVVVVAVGKGTGIDAVDAVVSEVTSTVADAVGSAASDATEAVEEEIVSRIADSSDSGDVTAIVTAIMAGDTVSDETYISAFGGDAEAYYQVKEAAASYGVDLNDGSQLRRIVASNLGNLDGLDDVVSDYLEGSIDVDELMSQLNDMLDLS